VDAMRRVSRNTFPYPLHKANMDLVEIGL
jgi:hypothetical protein